ncbi:MAG: hypothetical protein HIU89_17955 [Proteobacteria bacterium]|nr:hypothetical protein [Pseudomonadota bacterium]
MAETRYKPSRALSISDHLLRRQCVPTQEDFQFIIEADSRDEALRVASMHPAATLGEEGGWAVELIPMDYYVAR